MVLYELLDAASIEIALSARTKEEAMAEMVEILYRAGKIKDRDTVLKALWDRERVMSTGLENGVAIPHCKTESVDRLVAALGISQQGIDFQSHDGKPAKIIFALVAERNNPGPHVKALARLSRLLSNPRVREAFLSARSSDELLETIKKREEGE